MKTRSDYYREFLNIFWLRPENALLSAIRAEKLLSTVPKNFSDLRSIDVSCGDGLFSFISFGGQLASSSDVFRTVDTSKRREGNFDAFDSFDENYSLEITNRPDVQYSLGCDWKGNLLRRAKLLEWYEDLFEHDNNKRLPLEPDSVDFIYTNSSYWVEKFEEHLNDLVRISAPGAKIVFEMKTREIAECTSARYAPFLGEKANKIIDAGRMETWRGLRSLDEIRRIFDGLEGAEVTRFEPVYGGLPVMMWDIGLRPLFRPLAWLANEADEATRRSSKEEWCAVLFDLLSDFLEDYEALDSEGVEWLIELKKNG